LRISDFAIEEQMDFAIELGSALAGCGQALPWPVGEYFTRNITITDNVFTVARTFAMYIPSSYKPDVASPLMMVFHGQYGDALGCARGYEFAALSEEKGFISVYPQGMEDGNCGAGWNVGESGHDPNVCTNQANSGTCCYDSCKVLGRCTGDRGDANCGWATCHNDPLFVSSIYSMLSEELCLDPNAVYAHGGSNGGMLIYNLVQELPDLFKSVSPLYGSPLEGGFSIPSNAADVSIMHLHSRNDRIIPVEGGNGGGWFYTPADEIMRQWATAYGCASPSDANPVAFATPFDGGDRELECMDYAANCGEVVNDGKVVLCLFNGGHDGT
jgi:polyhydroxybutyrate depolymerase